MHPVHYSHASCHLLTLRYCSAYCLLRDGPTKSRTTHPRCHRHKPSPHTKGETSPEGRQLIGARIHEWMSRAELLKSHSAAPQPPKKKASPNTSYSGTGIWSAITSLFASRPGPNAAGSQSPLAAAKGTTRRGTAEGNSARVNRSGAKSQQFVGVGAGKAGGARRAGAPGAAGGGAARPAARLVRPAAAGRVVRPAATTGVRGSRGLGGSTGAMGGAGVGRAGKAAVKARVGGRAGGRGGGSSSSGGRGGVGGASSGGGSGATDLEKRILDDLMDHAPGVSFDAIAGLTVAKRTLHESIILPNLRPDIFTGLRAPPKGVLLFGPPGTGKTMLVRDIHSSHHHPCVLAFVMPNHAMARNALSVFSIQLTTASMKSEYFAAALITPFEALLLSEFCHRSLIGPWGLFAVFRLRAVSLF